MLIELFERERERDLDVDGVTLQKPCFYLINGFVCVAIKVLEMTYAVFCEERTSHGSMKPYVTIDFMCFESNIQYTKQKKRLTSKVRLWIMKG